MAQQLEDEGFHEIQLNGKQLVFLFMAATVVSVVIFLCGVLVGRGVRAERSVVDTGPATSAADTTPQPAPAPPQPPGSDPTTAAAPPPAADDLSYFKRLEKPNAQPEQLKSAPSVAIPIGQLGLLLIAVPAALMGNFPLLLGLAVMYILPAVVRGMMIRRRTRVAFAQAFAVSLVYDTARALALCVRAGHRRATLAGQGA